MKTLAILALCVLLAVAPVQAIGGGFRRCSHGFTSSCSHGCFNNCGVPFGYVPLYIATPVGLPSYVRYEEREARTISYGGRGGYGESYRADGYGYGRDAGYDRHGEYAGGYAKRPTEPAPVAAPRENMVKSLCAKCHNGQNDKTALSLVGEPTDAQRVKMIARVMSLDPAKRMPKGKELDPVEIEALVAEISKAD